MPAKKYFTEEERKQAKKTAEKRRTERCRQDPAYAEKRLKSSRDSYNRLTKEQKILKNKSLYVRYLEKHGKERINERARKLYHDSSLDKMRNIREHKSLYAKNKRKNFTEKDREKDKQRMRLRREMYPQKCNQRHKQRMELCVAFASDSYIIHQIREQTNLSLNDVIDNPELIELKRISILSKRLIKNHTRNEQKEIV